MFLVTAFQVCDPQIERSNPPIFRDTRFNQGLDAVQAHVALHRGNWAKGACEPQRLIVAGERIVVLLHVRVRLAHETEWREGRITDVFTFRNGKAIQWRTFADERQAHVWAGGTPQGRLTSTVAVRAPPETANGKCPSDTLT